MKQEAIIIDLDGTLCDNAVRLEVHSDNHKDYWPLYQHIPEDKPNKWCVDIIKMADLYDCKLIFLTARPEHVEELTRDWLLKHLLLISYSYELIMMPNNYRYKAETFKKARIKELKKKYDILFAIDDRKENVKVFKEQNIMCLYCGEE